MASLGFALADNGYDASVFMLKAYMTAVTPASQHDDVFIMVTLTGAIGGCVTTPLGFIDRTVPVSQPKQGWSAGQRDGPMPRASGSSLGDAVGAWDLLPADWGRG